MIMLDFTINCTNSIQTNVYHSTFYAISITLNIPDPKTKEVWTQIEDKEKKLNLLCPDLRGLLQ